MDPNSEADPVSASSAVPAPSVERSLNYRQEKFCVHYSLSGNGAEAARLAGYSERSAHTQGHRLTRDPRVRNRVYEIRVARAVQFGPVVAFTRLEHLFQKASEAKDYRGAAAILTLQAKLAGVESWTPPSAIVRDRPRGGTGHRRGALGAKGSDPFANLSESCGLVQGGPENGGTENDAQR